MQLISSAKRKATLLPFIGRSKGHGQPTTATYTHNHALNWIDGDKTPPEEWELHILVMNRHSRNPVTVSLLVNGIELCMEIDTEASVSRKYEELSLFRRTSL